MKKKIIIGFVVSCLFNSIEVVNARTKIISSEIYQDSVKMYKLDNGAFVSYDLGTHKIIAAGTSGDLINFLGISDLYAVELEAIETVLLENSSEYLKAKNEKLDGVELEVIASEILNRSSEFKRISAIIDRESTIYSYEPHNLR